MSKSKSSSIRKLFENIKFEEPQALDNLNNFSLDQAIFEKVEFVKKKNEEKANNQKLKQITALSLRLFKDCKKYPEWNDLSFELLMNVRGELIRILQRRNGRSQLASS